MDTHLLENKIYLLSLDVDKTFLEESDNFSKTLNLLPENDRNKIQKYRNLDDQYRKLCSKLLQFYGISKITGMRLNKIIFKANQLGKPYLDNGRRVEFNMSTGISNVVMALYAAPDFHKIRPIGVDIIDLDEINSLEDIELLHDSFHEKEIILLESLTNIEEARQYACLFWTLKESYSKMLGSGLSTTLADLDYSSVPLPKNNKVYATSMHIKGRDCIVYIKQSTESNCLISVCIWSDNINPEVSELAIKISEVSDYLRTH
ncbi:hypothetical protein TBLA_0B07130 [Henningerozyma blattae CBS 6284]|uniref:holo-[acyl-carrier-protein] synthase n=1 Tax=Henningerozyma blattae (strain ATCC 34711 / CBS 6284 / DSM 70876 / NBRC 10599 / NRRL Y-10934 / UCD 77-7) TaxID=1071380 RepID=I2GZH8_HENB6|nr:hypothetical protein TBLA_0B07130 [Tetrapisispora blattae CBS 6284]CCH59530.1 hypothetical protein TBLA_0B07130 [Tetrapisispora blattae CBS 6284]